MSIDKIKPEDYEAEEKCDFGKNMGDDISDQEWDKQIDAKASNRQEDLEKAIHSLQMLLEYME